MSNIEEVQKLIIEYLEKHYELYLKDLVHGQNAKSSLCVLMWNMYYRGKEQGINDAIDILQSNAKNT